MSEGIDRESFQRLLEKNSPFHEFMDRILNNDYFVVDQWQQEEQANTATHVDLRDHLWDNLSVANEKGQML